ncbi:MAG: RdgB/HAM1 family non-canonical purine NTP pyrophosphatase [Gemmatimonadota bacterium]|nr:MAG: RdgB/HAM1 family non-canonical purine NTP pyrophosphatase [Gemmatimonadota bacterium]
MRDAARPGPQRGLPADQTAAGRDRGGLVKLAVATRNQDKLREIAPIFRDTPVRLVSLAELGVERRREEERLEGFSSFAHNALAKAQYFHDRTGLPMMAEDSGIRVDALDGEPGPRSKRYAPPEMQTEYGVDRANNLYLLRRLRDVPDERRTAHFHCAVALVLEDESRVFGGRVDGVILREPRGEGGFGYDPLFCLPDRGVTTAELTVDQKNEISHRGQAMRAARDWLSEVLGR